MASSEIRRGDFVYHDTLFAEVGENKRHPRASATEIRDQLLPKRGSIPPKDNVGHWYEAQLLHYGLPRTKNKNTAKMRLLQAVAQGSLVVPSYLVQMEAQMKKEYATATRKAKVGASRSNQEAIDQQTLSKTKKRKQDGMGSANTKVRVTVGDVSFDIDHQSGQTSQPSAKKQKKNAPTRKASAAAVSNQTTPAARQRQTARRTHPFTPTDPNDAPPPYEAYDLTNPSPRTPSPIPRRSNVVQISGYYSITTIPDLGPDEKYITFRIDHRQDKLWGRFDIGYKTGIIMVNGIDSIPNGDTTSFGWRSRNEETGSLKFGKGCDGRMEFDGRNFVRGTFYGILDGNDLVFEGQREYDDAPDADILEEEWNDFPEIAYGRR